jgi:hypothetical protein
MKTKKSYRRTKAETRALKWKTILSVSSLILCVFSVYFIYVFGSQSPKPNLILPTLQFKPENPSAQLKAAIVDQLSLTFPNQTFIEASADTLTEAGYTVDYFSGENVTAEFFTNLPSYEYRIVILRIHSSTTTAEKAQESLAIFTSERYSSSKYLSMQIKGQLVSVSFSEDEMKRGVRYFGICPRFVSECMVGRFQNTVVITMGCQGLENTLMARAFVEKGAGVYVGWSQSVTASHTDAATGYLLQHFLTEKQTLKQALQETFKEVGFDPVYRSLLIYYPLNVGAQTADFFSGKI